MLREGVPQRISVEGAIATRAVFQRNPHKLSGCLYDANGQRIALSERVGGLGGDKVPTSNPESIDVPNGLPVVPGHSLYLGHFMSRHYGHFLLEGLSSVWAVAEVGDVDTFVMHEFVFGREMTVFNRDLFTACGVHTSKILLVAKPVAFERITVPERLLAINISAHVRLRETFAKIREMLARPVAAERVYLSRARLPELRQRIANEAAVEALFEQHGFTIVHPQEVSIADQISMYANCRVLAGLSGSALHNVVFCRPKTHLIDIHDTRKPTSALKSQVLCNELAEVDYRPVSFVRNGSENTISIDAIKRVLRDLAA